MLKWLEFLCQETETGWLCFTLREEQEKLNVWGALLNLENMYGTEETLMKVFERAVQYNEPLKVFQHLADIYTNSEKHKVGVWGHCWSSVVGVRVIAPH